MFDKQQGTTRVTTPFVPGTPEARDAQAMLSETPLFRSFAADDLKALFARPGALRRLDVAAGSDIVCEDDAADDLMVIRQGEAQVLKRSERGELHEVNRLRAGASIGELALIDPAPRSATVRAVGPVELWVIPIADMLAVAAQRPSFAMALLGSAGLVVERLRLSTARAVEALERSLDEERKRSTMGKFTFLLIVAYTLYTWVLGTATQVKQALGRSELVTVPVVIFCAAILIYFMRSSGYSPAFFGLTLKRAGRHLVQACLLTLPLMALAVALKWWLVTHVVSMQGQPLLQMFAGGVDGQPAAHFNPWLSLAYVVFVPFQELIYRGGLQGALEHFLTGPWRRAMAILGSNIIFSAAHLYISVGLSVTAFLAGLFWGRLYSEQRSLVGVSASHIVLGFWAFEVVGLGVLA